MLLTKQKNINLFLISLITVIFSCCISLVSIAIISKLDYAILGRQLLGNFYWCHHNYCQYGNLGDMNAIFFFYGIIFFSALTIRVLCLRGEGAQRNSDFSQIFKYTTIIVFCLLMTLQTASHISSFLSEYKAFANKPLMERYPPPIKRLKEYASFVREILPGAQSAAFATDMDISRDPGMFYHRAFAYYLYPVDIRNIRGLETDYLIVLHTGENALQVPPNYQILGSVDGECFVATKQGDHK
jgi:hypothetical protein